MTDSRRGKGRLVADRRYPKKPTKAAKRRKAAPTRRKASKSARRKPRRGIVGFFSRIIGWILRLILRLFFRAGIVAALRDAGAEAGDDVKIGSIVFTFDPEAVDDEEAYA